MQRRPSRSTATQRSSSPATGAARCSAVDDEQAVGLDVDRPAEAFGDRVRQPPSIRRCGTARRRPRPRRRSPRGSRSHAPNSVEHRRDERLASPRFGFGEHVRDASPPAASSARSASRPYSARFVAELGDHGDVSVRAKQHPLHLDAARRHRGRLRVAPVVLDGALEPARVISRRARRARRSPSAPRRCAGRDG